MRKYSALVSLIVLAIFVAGPVSALRAAGGGNAEIPTEVTPEDAAKKYPPPAGKSYPEGLPSEAANTGTGGGFYKSPYSSRMYDCRKVKPGVLILDKSVNKVFVRPKSGA
jgi:hypothetical protein